MLIDTINIKPNTNKNYPFNLGLFSSEITLDVKSPVTLFVGENGCGKSSLIKLLQAKLSLVEIQLPNAKVSDRINSKTVVLKPSLGRLKGFYFESLSFINYIDYVQNEIVEAKEEMKRVDLEYQGRSDYVKGLAKAPFARTIHDLTNMYSNDLSKSSHGESYLDFFSSRIRDNQIYLLDEPETPLSVQNQLTLMAMIMEATKRGCQFIIATHSPMLTAIPNSLIYEIKNNQFVRTSHDDIESIKLLRQFLNNKEQFLRYLQEE